TRSWRDKLAVWFKPPGWLPADLAGQPDSTLPQIFDPPLAAGIKTYVFLQFWIITGVSIWALAIQNDLSRLAATSLFVWMLLSLCSLGMMMDNLPRALGFEALRFLAILVPLALVLPLGFSGLTVTTLVSATGIYLGLSGGL